MTYVLAYDIGTTGVKTCLFSVEERIGLLASAQEGYGLRLLEGGQQQVPRPPDDGVAGGIVLQDGNGTVDLTYKIRIFFLIIHNYAAPP